MDGRHARVRPWDYLIVTASNERQAEAYGAQLDLRRELGLLGDVREVLVVADPDGRRIGSGGSTLYCLMEVLSRRLQDGPAAVATASCPCTSMAMSTSWSGKASPGWPRDARAGRVPKRDEGRLGSPRPRHGRPGKEVPNARLRVGDPQDGRATQGRDALATWEQVLGELRILILHAGGDSRRLPAYSACGKLFIPVPGENDSAVCLSLFDRQLPTYLALPEPMQGRGQVVITSGDVLLRFDPTQVRFKREGVTGLACHAHPQQASRHGVFCCGRDDEVRLFLQKPSIAEQKAKGAIDTYGQSCLDIGVMHFDAATAVRLLQLFGAKSGPDGRLAFTGKRGQAVLERGLDFYREICCAMGNQTSPDHHLRSARESGSKWTAACLGELFGTLSAIGFNVQLLKHCEFLDFGMNRSLINSGTRLLQEDQGLSHLQSCLDINNEITAGGAIQGSAAWVEGCRIHAPMTLAGDNVIAGIDVQEPLSLPAGMCLDVIRGRDERGKNTWFVRCYGVDDAFKEPADEGAIFCGVPLLAWLQAVGANENDVWSAGTATKDRTIWNARLFPAVRQPDEYCQWLWMFDPARASDAQRRAWRSARRYSLEQILTLADHKGFYERRSAIRAHVVRSSLQRAFRPQSGLSARELTALMRRTDRPAVWVAQTLQHACQWVFEKPVQRGMGFQPMKHRQDVDATKPHGQDASATSQTPCQYGADGPERGTASLVLPRIVHTLGSALLDLHSKGDRPVNEALPELAGLLDPATARRLRSMGVGPEGKTTVAQWCGRMQEVAFEGLEQAIVASGLQEEVTPHSVLRSDEIVWARAPARLDLGGGWTDTPPYALEWGGCVTNAAVDLNGQPPIQAYVRVIDEPVIRIGSIDLGVRIEVRRFEDLMDYRQATGSFALAKAALVLSGLSPEGASGRKSLRKALEAFGGGIELTTLAAIPKGSGLGTSSIMGAVIVASLGRVMGKQLSQRELFHSVLRLEQALTTGGGWQDQIGGVVDGVKMIVTEPGMVPDAHIHYLPSDILDPHANGGRTLLYYTGITRLAKNILQQVVGRYLNRDREAITTLRHIGALARDVMNTFIRKDIEGFGHLIDVAWQLNKRLDPNSSNDEIEALFARVRPHIYGGKLLGAGGGGFMLMVCKSPEDTAALRDMLERDPPNARARFFDFRVSTEGLVVTVC